MNKNRWIKVRNEYKLYKCSVCGALVNRAYDYFLCPDSEGKPLKKCPICNSIMGENTMSKLINAAETAELISKKFNIPMADLVDVFAKIPAVKKVYVSIPWFVKEKMCDMYCRYPRECKTQEGLELLCEVCPMNKWGEKND